MPKAAIYIVAAMLLLGAMPLPYGYYTLLRIVACGFFAWAAFISYEREYSVFPWIFGLLAIVFNPLIKIYLPKEIWMFIDAASAIFIVAAQSKIAEKKQTSTAS